MDYHISHIFLVFLGIWAFSCSSGESGESPVAALDRAKFNDYWYQGKAELTRYRLEQARYGEIHQGDAVLIFVTEDFWADRQVKYEFGERTDQVKSVLKLNFTRKFYTGIYPYSMMTSVFTPIDAREQKTLKVTNSSQEWCGHTFMQLNYRDNRYSGNLYSYFQAEGDRRFELPAVLLEDEIWTLVRLDPSRLPLGEIELIPGSAFLRLRHREAAVQPAIAELTTVTDESLSPKKLAFYRVEYRDIPRQLKIYFQPTTPYEIVAWEEETMSGFGDPRKLTTRAVRTHSLLLDYWNKNSVADSTYRRQLGL